MDHKRRLKAQITTTELLRKYVEDFTRAQLYSYRLIFQMAGAAVKRVTPGTLDDLPELPGLLADDFGLNGSAENESHILEGLLATLQTDAFLQNLTVATEAAVDFVDWFKTSSEGHVEMFLETTANTTTEKAFATDFDSFLRHRSKAELDFLVQLASMASNFAQTIPNHMLKADFKSQLAANVGNLSVFVRAVENITLPNLTGTTGGTFCSVVTRKLLSDADVAGSIESVLGLVLASQQALPGLERAFVWILPRSAPARLTPHQIPPVMRRMLNASGSILMSMRDYRLQLRDKLLPHLQQHMNCGDVPELEPISDEEEPQENASLEEPKKPRKRRRRDRSSAAWRGPQVLFAFLPLVWLLFSSV